jgi:hypothetical protein
MANWLDMIRWNGETGEPGQYQVIRPISVSVSAVATSTGRTGTGEENATFDVDALKAWLDAVDAWMPKEEKWIDDSITFSESEGSRGDLPAPIPPALPDLAEYVSLPALIAQFGPWGIVIFVGLRVVKRIAEGWLEKKMNPGVGDLKKAVDDLRDAVKKGLLYNNGNDPILLKAFLDNALKPYLAALPDLAYVDAIVDFGPFRCHLKGRMIEY